MKKHITDEQNGLEYELVGDYYIVAGEDDPPSRPIGIWGMRRKEYLKQHRQSLYYELLFSGKLNDHLADIEEQAQDIFSLLVKEYAEKEGITEQLKATDQMKWVQKMNNIRERVSETVCSNVVFV